MIDLAEGASHLFLGRRNSEWRLWPRQLSHNVIPIDDR